MNPSDFDDDSGALSFSDLPPSIARQYGSMHRGTFPVQDSAPTMPRPIRPGTPVAPITYPIVEQFPTQPPIGVQPSPVTGTQPMPPPTATPVRPGPTPVQPMPTQPMPVTGGPGGLVPVPIERYRDANPPMVPVPAPPGQLVPVVTPETPKDNSTLLFIAAAAVLSGLGYWAYTKMEKDKRKMRVGPPAGQTADYGDDDGDDSGLDEDDGEPGGPLDAYEDAGLDEKDVDPHEEGGIKLVKG